MDTFGDTSHPLLKGRPALTLHFSELEPKRWAKQMAIPREGNERDAGEQEQRRMNARPPAETRSFPKSHSGNCQHEHSDCGEPAGYV